MNSPPSATGTLIASGRGASGADIRSGARPRAGLEQLQPSWFRSTAARSWPRRSRGGPLDRRGEREIGVEDAGGDADRRRHRSAARLPGVEAPILPDLPTARQEPRPAGRSDHRRGSADHALGAGAQFGAELWRLGRTAATGSAICCASRSSPIPAPASAIRPAISTCWRRCSPKRAGELAVARARMDRPAARHRRSRPWTRDPQGLYMGGNNMALSPRAMVAFGEAIRTGGAPVGSCGLDRGVLAAAHRSPFSGDDDGYAWFLAGWRARRCLRLRLRRPDDLCRARARR